MSFVVQPFPFASEFHAGRSTHVSLAELETEVAALRLEVRQRYEQGRADGASEALAALRAERDTALLAASEVLAAALSRFDERFADAESAVARIGADLALDFADHLAARALEREPAAAIELALARVLDEVRRGQPLRVKVAPDLLDAVEQLVARRQASDRRRLPLTVVADAGLAAGDARIEWDGGALALDLTARRDALRAEIAGLLAA